MSKRVAGIDTFDGSKVEISIGGVPITMWVNGLDTWGPGTYLDPSSGINIYRPGCGSCTLCRCTPYGCGYEQEPTPFNLRRAIRSLLNYQWTPLPILAGAC